MKKILFAMALTLAVSIAMTACSNAENPGTPPQEVINPQSTSAENDTPTSENSAADEDIIESAVSIRIGRDSRTELAVNMYNNAAANTMLDYLSGSDLLFPTYSYSDEEGFVGQRVRGTYTRDDDVTVTDIAAGELYLFGDGQLRLYFKDAAGANITATPIGFLAESEGITETVQEAYESNLNDTWGVDVYFWITKLV